MIAVRLERVQAGAVAIVHDITAELRRQRELQREREALLHEERMHAMGVLASGVAHDLNHVLNIIALRVATLRADAQAKSQSKDCIGATPSGRGSTTGCFHTRQKKLNGGWHWPLMMARLCRTKRLLTPALAPLSQTQPHPAFGHLLPSRCGEEHRRGSRSFAIFEFLCGD